jgi:hypothetical protein
MPLTEPNQAQPRGLAYCNLYVIRDTGTGLNLNMPNRLYLYALRLGL